MSCSRALELPPFWISDSWPEGPESTTSPCPSGPPNLIDAEIVAKMLHAYDEAGEPLSRQERLAVPLAIARQPAWSVGHWVRQLDEQDAIDHAREAARELPVAQAILRDLSDWQRTLVTQHRPKRGPGARLIKTT